MPQFTIDGKTYEYEGNQRLLEFCIDNGVEIPYFCYHPAMSTPTNCRMCLVKVGWAMKDRATGEAILDEEGKPKVQWGRKPATACNQPITPGMIVETRESSTEVKEMQEGVLEYMLANHPLDCPICDQAGECPLQIWTYKYGPEGSRFEVPKIHKPKRIELGPNVTLDAERCINCTRCTRFTEEVSNTWQLTIHNRGEKNHPTTAPGEVFDDPYSMNTIDLCPVGALTSTQFRFKARVWEMAYTPGICNGCSQGCNTNVWIRDNEVLRQTPRENLEVNQYWMCDAGRLDIEKYNTGRVSGVKLRGDVPAMDFEAGLIRAANLLKEAAEGDSKPYFLGSAYASSESNFALKQLAGKFGVTKLNYVPNIQMGWGDDLLRKDDRTPNAAGCESVGMSAISLEDLKKEIADGSINFLYMLEDDRVLDALGSMLEGITVVAHSQNHTRAHDKIDVILPAATSIEGESTFINAKGIPQVTKMAKEIKQMTPAMWMRLPKSRLDKAAVAVDSWRDLDNVYDVLPSWQLIARISKYVGKELPWKEHKDVFARLKAEHEAFRDVKVSYKIPKEAFKYTQFDFAIT